MRKLQKNVQKIVLDRGREVLNVALSLRGVHALLRNFRGVRVLRPLAANLRDPLPLGVFGTFPYLFTYLLTYLLTYSLSHLLTDYLRIDSIIISSSIHFNNFLYHIYL